MNLYTGGTGKRRRQREASNSPSKRQRPYKSPANPTVAHPMTSEHDGAARAERELASIYNLETSTSSNRGPASIHLQQSRIRAIHEALQAAGGAEDDEGRGYTLRMIEALEVELDAMSSCASAARAAPP